MVRVAPVGGAAAAGGAGQVAEPRCREGQAAQVRALGARVCVLTFDGCPWVCRLWFSVAQGVVHSFIQQVCMEYLLYSGEAHRERGGRVSAVKPAEEVSLHGRGLALRVLGLGAWHGSGHSVPARYHNLPFHSESVPLWIIIYAVSLGTTEALRTCKTQTQNLKNYGEKGTHTLNAQGHRTHAVLRSPTCPFLMHLFSLVVTQEGHHGPDTADGHIQRQGPCIFGSAWYPQGLAQGQAHSLPPKYLLNEGHKKFQEIE